MAPYAFLLLLGCCGALASARVHLKSPLLSEAATTKESLLRKKAHHHLIEKWGLPLVVAAKHVVPLWVAGAAGFLAVVLAHSPLSPLPVPPLPHAPVGRFPPKQTVLKNPGPVHIVTVHHVRRRRAATSVLSQQKPATPVGSMLVQGTNSVNRLLQWLRLAGYAPNGWPTPGPSKLKPVAQMALDSVVRLQPAKVLRAALAVSAAYRPGTDSSPKA
ncbi:uncharacterized protein LOC119386457 isoform X2 [Rhipicephalus sanguineus]|uniref:uncharacterized protein LOC119386457 isoform X2 n=1 Tax=Rhipicephalus sanguineus TaxID=34632 RepID=UPI00189345B8|nr:uncharacterized protein LOC119386457 isoform X2 [Rhipicephalus sanguineus]